MRSEEESEEIIDKSEECTINRFASMFFFNPPTARGIFFEGRIKKPKYEA